uniref:Uncharacterized protein n=1 Tax=Setaria italica TaxID=4555 RepID=K3YFQ2_SETIT
MKSFRGIKLEKTLLYSLHVYFHKRKVLMRRF